MPPGRTLSPNLFFPDALAASAATVFQIVARSSNGYSDARNKLYLLNVDGATSARSWHDIEASEDENEDPLNCDAISAIAFPLTAKYDPKWIRDNALGENALCQAECLARRLPLHAGMRILDLGCGKAASSIFLAREFGVEVWAADGATSPTENRKRAVALECEASVFPLRVDAHSLPFAKDFFDAVVAIDSFLYYGTDDRYLSYLVQFIKPGGFIGVVDIAFTREIRSIEDAPEYLHPQYQKHWSYVHSIEWWTQHWEKTGMVDVRCAELLPESNDLLRNYVRDRLPDQDEDSIMRAVPYSNDGLISLFCLVACKR